MAIKPILFNTEMVRAILDGRKTQTRRLVKPAQLRVLQSKFRKDHPEIDDKTLILNTCVPPCRPGDILYVRETWLKLFYVDENGRTHYDKEVFYYAADGEPDVTLYDADGFRLDIEKFTWHPSIHMPKEAARIFLLVKRVWVERLQDIDGAGQRAEGADSEHGFGATRGAFMALWNSTIKPDVRAYFGWKANPLVWVIEFERCEKPEAV